MKIAVTSQNRRDITEHAGRCRNFRVYEVDDGVEVLIAGGMGEGLRVRLARRGIEAVVTTERDPDRAVEAWLGGCLPPGRTHVHSHGTDHGPDDPRACSCGEGCGCH